MTRQDFVRGAAVFFAAATALAQAPPATLTPRTDADELQVARLDASGKLLKPDDLTNWVFLGASLGMGYNPGSFNASRPGQFQVVLMEPSAYRFFAKHKRYATGSMFLLSFYDSAQRRSINQAGFVQADLTNYEIHLIAPRDGDERHQFYMFDAKATRGNPLPKDNGCVRCHVDHGAFDGTFAQFYPTARPHLPEGAIERGSKLDDIR
jgi:hypothetical protein